MWALLEYMVPLLLRKEWYFVVLIADSEDNIVIGFIPAQLHELSRPAY
jgi:hypothetical protein